MSYLDHLRSFVAVHRLASVTAAARSLGLTQPAVTGHLKALEARLGRPLFERAGRGIVATATADALAARIGNHIDALETVLDGVASRGSELAGTLTIGGPAEFLTERGLAALAPLVARRIAVHTSFGLARDLISQLERGDLELVAAAQRIPRPAIAYQQLFTERFLLVGVPAFCELISASASVETIAAELQSAPWVAYATDLPMIRRFFRTGLERDLTPTQISTAPDLRAVRAMVAAGAGISVLPDYLCEPTIAAGELVELWRPAIPVTNTVWLATGKASRHPRVSLAIELLREAAAGWTATEAF
jgi:DNA-binding transcriptional LysR family regulator